MVGIASFGAYVPLYRLARQEMGEAWGIPAVPGERAVANADEDSITMAVAAGLDCLAGFDASAIDGLYFATTTAPYVEAQGASIIASALDLRSDIFTADFTDSTRSATVALRAAHDAIESGSATAVLVLAADCRPAEPETLWEQILGDGAGALLLTKNGRATIEAIHSVSGEVVGPWRRAGDPYVRSFEPKLETEYGYMRSMVAAIQGLQEKVGLSPQDIAKAVLYAADPRSHATLARRLGLEMPQVQDTMFIFLGNTGTALVPMMLAAALEQAKAGDRILVANYGDGADAILLQGGEAFPPAEGRAPVSAYLSAKRALPNYNAFVAFRQLMERDRWVPKSSTVTYWRDSKAELGLYGARCRACGVVVYPPQRVCPECAAKDELEPTKVSRRGTIFTYTLDHLVGGDYMNVPVPRTVVDLEGGGRIFLEMTDCDPQEVAVGMPVELTFRRLHQGGAFHNYYWKCKPVRIS